MAYIEKTLALGLTLPRGHVHHVAVMHDKDCQFMVAGGPCTCNADVGLVDGPPLQWRKDLKRRFREKRRNKREA